MTLRAKIDALKRDPLRDGWVTHQELMDALYMIEEEVSLMGKKGKGGKGKC